MNYRSLITTTTVAAVICCCCSLFPLAATLDTIFAKGGTCLYKIYDQYQACMAQQNARLTREKDHLEPIYTREALTDSVNKISCCAYWQFLACVESAAAKQCPNDERRDMRAYVRQLGSAVPIEDCAARYPRNSPLCAETYSSSGGESNLSRSSITFILITTTVLTSLILHSLSFTSSHHRI